MTTPLGTPRSYAVVLNPQAGGGAAMRAWPALRAELEARHLPYVVIHESSGGAALARVEALAPEVAVLAVGGDGTVSGLLPAVVGTGRPLGIVPLGTGNDFAGMLGLRPGQLVAALDRLAFAPCAVDALEVIIEAGEQQGRRAVLLNGLGMGFDAQVAATTAHAPARLKGFARYAWAALVTVRNLSTTTVTVSIDGAELYEGPSALVAVMNGTRYGGGFVISPDSKVRDGRLNVLVSREVTRAGLVGLMGRVLRGRHLGHPQVLSGSGSEVVVVWDAPVALHLDGDLAGQITRLRATVVPGAVVLLSADICA